ncbi:peptidoglycan DD-metalloendopeptidase family protein [Craterilacuibacter sp. RT1T]|uniref:murein hydrolase activator EnvC family protein n=1 Tax=Craterilacuibacter sp. RT1T TaxID=2942211 RepID=UPI0020BF7C54|nr:peptidoglycan DD-metalloendopeptidase family protein [Craterilacuibacter sp. RT1T]
MKIWVLLLLLSGAAQAAPDKPPAVAPHQQDLSSVRKEISTLKKDIAQKEAIRKEAQSAIRESEQALQATRQALNQLDSKQQMSSRKLAELQSQLQETHDSALDLKSRIAAILQRQHRGGSHDAMRLMLNQADPNQSSRDLTYYRYIAQAQQGLIQNLSAQESELQALAAQVTLELEKLGAQSHRQESQQDKLAREKATQEQQASALASEIRNKQGTLSKLQQDEKRLSSLIAQINRQIAAQRQAAARKKAEERKARALARKQENERRRKLAADAKLQGKTLPAEATRPIKEEAVEAVADASSSGKAFRSLQGRMQLPVSGNIAGRYGSRRPEGSSWKGLFIRTSPGQAVRAVADGTVVYADALRGFGNAVIVDHGGNYMTVYTGLGGISRGSGQAVKGGDTLGNTGTLDSGESGLYFELRYMGRPINPQSWMR